jgi:hypothetical protein
MYTHQQCLVLAEIMRADWHARMTVQVLIGGQRASAVRQMDVVFALAQYYVAVSVAGCMHCDINRAM